VRQLRRVLRLDRAALDEIVDRRAVAMAEHGQGVTLLQQILRHAVAHEAEADETDALRHRDVLRSLHCVIPEAERSEAVRNPGTRSERGPKGRCSWIPGSPLRGAPE
jgi:hypothetical protein